MSDIVEELRAQDISGHGHYASLVRRAADEIERLTAALREIAERPVGSLQTNDIARAALEGKP